MKTHDFCLKDYKENTYCLKDFKGRWLVLYFYPKDNTSGCTKEAKEFSDNIEFFEENNAIVVGISPDSPKKHENFIKKHDLKILLLSDETHEVIEKYGCWKLKKMYGREYYGVERSTFLINPKGEIVFEWRKVRVKDHVEEVKKKLLEFV